MSGDGPGRSGGSSWTDRDAGRGTGRAVVPATTRPVTAPRHRETAVCGRFRPPSRGGPRAEGSGPPCRRRPPRCRRRRDAAQPSGDGRPPGRRAAEGSHPDVSVGTAYGVAAEVQSPGAVRSRRPRVDPVGALPGRFSGIGEAACSRAGERAPGLEQRRHLVPPGVAGHRPGVVRGCCGRAQPPHATGEPGPRSPQHDAPGGFRRVPEPRQPFPSRSSRRPDPRPGRRAQPAGGGGGRSCRPLLGPCRRAGRLTPAPGAGRSAGHAAARAEGRPGPVRRGSCGPGR